MKLVMDERLKHRLIGIAVIVSIGAIFAPAIMKKSNQRFEEHSNISIQLPPKPNLPRVAVEDKEALFKTVKVAHVDISPVETSVPEQKMIAKAESLSQMNKEDEAAKIAKVSLPPAKPVVAVAKKIPARSVVAQTKQTSPVYTVQLASFSVQANALALVNQLQRKGYKASIAKVSHKRGIIYKVFVGNMDQKQQAIKLKQQLASSMQLQGFVTTKVS